ncbi:MAG: rRNA maturation RNase YbeY [Planctomycetia bacterium]
MAAPTRRTRGPRPGKAAAIDVHVLDRQRMVAVPARWLGGVVRRALAREGVTAAEISILIVGDRRMARLHEEWLGVPGPTDVITFDLADDAPDGGLRGDIVVSAETARRVAREVGWRPRHELAYYVVHGLLHLAGYDDHDPADRRAMRARERVLLRAAGLPTPPAVGSRR